jgi:hypothetical protein
MQKVRLASLVAVCTLFPITQADAMKPFKDAFDAKYVTPANDAAFTAASKQAGCFVCHAKGEKKDVRNAYGEALAAQIPGNAKQRMQTAGAAGAKAEMEKLLRELNDAFAKVEAEKSADGTTYGDLLKQHKLPAP